MGQSLKISFKTPITSTFFLTPRCPLYSKLILKFYCFTIDYSFGNTLQMFFKHNAISKNIFVDSVQMETSMPSRLYDVIEKDGETTHFQYVSMLNKKKNSPQKD